VKFPPGFRKAKWKGSKWVRRYTRVAIYLRDGYACVYCGKGEDEDLLTLDHRVPAVLGGDNRPSNLVTACLTCNSAKADLSVRAFLAQLRERGVDTTKVAPRIRRLVRKPLDRIGARVYMAEQDAARKGEAGVAVLMLGKIFAELAMVTSLDAQAIADPYAWPPRPLMHDDERREVERLNVLSARFAYKARELGVCNQGGDALFGKEQKSCA
jgi:hypothetical protein